MNDVLQHFPIQREIRHDLLQPAVLVLERSAGAVFADKVTAIARETFDRRNAHGTGGVTRALERKLRDFDRFAADAARAGARSATA